MGYEVLVEELRSAAGDYQEVADGLGTGAMCLTYRGPTHMGHVELAAWLGAVAEQCTEASKALHDGAVDLGEDLRTAATHYETTDEAVAQGFSTPFGSSPGNPFGVGSPFGTSPLFPPLGGAQ